MLNGILCIDKPSDWTSFDVVAKVRGMTKTKKIGHAGTLDPMATGVLPLFFGNATKVCDILPNDKKGYLAQFRLGITTDTLDITGTVQTRQQSCVTRAQLERVLPDFTGEIAQIPPMFSAIQIDGRRLYDIARAGGEVKRKPRQVKIFKLSLLEFDESEQTAVVEVLCSKGTYIRTLCSDIGEALHTGAVLTKLQRHIAGDFMLKDCMTLQQLQQITDKQQLEQYLLPTHRVFESLPKIKLNRVQSIKFRNGVKLDLNRVYHQTIEGFHQVFDQENTFLGLASLDLEKMELKIEKIFVR